LGIQRATARGIGLKGELEGQDSSKAAQPGYLYKTEPLGERFHYRVPPRRPNCINGFRTLGGEERQSRGIETGRNRAFAAGWKKEKGERKKTWEKKNS